MRLFCYILLMSQYAKNKKAHFDYEILDKYEAGIQLSGFETKAVRTGKASLEGSFVIVRGGEAFLMGASIEPYQASNAPADYDRQRNRKLLLTKKEIKELGEIEKNKSLTIVPISMYNKGRKIKIEIATARGKKKYDKRETIKKRETDIEIRREYKRER